MPELTTVAKQKFNYYSEVNHPTREHFPTFYHFGTKCKRIVEMGVWKCASSWAWLACCPDYLRLVDIERIPGGDHNEIETEAAAMGVDFKFEIGDTGHGATFNSIVLKDKEFAKRYYDIPTVPNYVMDDNIDLLYIDSYHSYTHALAELNLHAHKVNKYLVFHDTETYGETHDFDGDLGINPAIREYIAEHPEWYYIHKISYGDGCTVLGNKNNVNDEPNMDPLFRYPKVTFDVPPQQQFQPTSMKYRFVP